MIVSKNLQKLSAGIIATTDTKVGKTENGKRMSTEKDIRLVKFKMIIEDIWNTLSMPNLVNCSSENFWDESEEMV